MERIERYRAFAHVRHALRHSHEHQADLILAMIAGELTQHRDKSRVICAGAHEAHRKDGVVRSIGVGVMAEFAERFEDVELRIRDAAERERKWNRAPNHRLAITNLQYALISAGNSTKQKCCTKWPKTRMLI